MHGAMQYRRWVEEAREHWKEHRPREFKRLQEEGRLESALRKAAEATADEMATLKEQGFDHHQAWEMVRQTYLFLPEEPRFRRSPQAKERPRAGDSTEVPAKSHNRSTANQSAERQTWRNRVEDGPQRHAPDSFQRAAAQRRTHEHSTSPNSYESPSETSTPAASVAPSSANLTADRIAAEWQQRILSNFRTVAAESQASGHATLPTSYESQGANSTPVESPSASTATPSQGKDPELSALADRLLQGMIESSRKNSEDVLAGRPLNTGRKVY